jgi:flagellar hook-basal body protein
MTNLGLAGASSLQSLNQWISLIDTNITNSKRIGYKETRISLKSNEVETIGKTFTHFGEAIQVPSSSLLLDKTLILDYVQGSLTSTENNTDFAIDGKGYFVVEDVDGKKYATRDGQFHFNNDGYLINADGLKVLSAGQDYIRVPVTEHFYVDSSGTSLKSSLYGDRQLMMINLPNAGKLYYSKYGFTSFELGDLIPISIDNSFDKTMDGLNPYLAEASHSVAEGFDAVAGDDSITLDSASGISVGSTITINGQSVVVDGVIGTFVTFTGQPLVANAGAGTVVKVNYQNAYTHTKISPNTTGNVTVDLTAHSQALLTAHKFSDFNNYVKFTDAGDPNLIASYGFNFGMKNASDTLSDSGYFAGIENGQLVIRTGSEVLNSTALPTLASGTEYQLSLQVRHNIATLVLNDSTTGVELASLVADKGIDGYGGTYQSLGTNDVTGGTAGHSISLTEIHIQETGGKPYYDTVMLGGSPTKLNSLVRQQTVEESTATLADQLPILNNAQKMFAALGKIVSVANLITDDLNGLIR